MAIPGPGAPSAPSRRIITGPDPGTWYTVDMSTNERQNMTPSGLAPSSDPAPGQPGAGPVNPFPSAGGDNMARMAIPLAQLAPPYLPQEERAARPARVLMGIDPGASGGIAWIHRGDCRIRCIPMPASTHDLWQWLCQWRRPDVRVFAMVEQVGGYFKGAESSGNSGGAANATRMFSFGRQYGEILMGLCAAGIKWGAVMPQVWQGYLHLKKMRGEQGTAYKRRLKEDALRRYPTLHITNATADAVLICTYLNKVGVPNV